MDFWSLPTVLYETWCSHGLHVLLTLRLYMKQEF